MHEEHYFAFLCIRLVSRPELIARWIFTGNSQLLTDDGQWTATNFLMTNAGRLTPNVEVRIRNRNRILVLILACLSADRMLAT